MTTARGGFEKALANLRRHRIRVYGTFIFGYDGDTPASFAPTVEFAREHALYIAAFNHLTPFPGTPLYRRLEKENLPNTLYIVLPNRQTIGEGIAPQPDPIKV